MDTIRLLKNDHKKVRKLLTELEATTTRGLKKRSQLLASIAQEIELHTSIEEEIFYPAFKEAGKKSEDDKMYFEALEEHRAVEDLVLPDLQATPVDSDRFGGRAKVLRELIEHHADEEEKTMFPRAVKLLDAVRLQELGKQMAERKRELATGGAGKTKSVLKGISDMATRLVDVIGTHQSPVVDSEPLGNDGSDSGYSKRFGVEKQKTR